jgi:nucleotide-binding universal stress UspA family protein
MRMLICFDGSDQARHAVAVAAQLFAGAQADVLHVWEPVERIVARYAVLAPFMGEELGEADASAESESMATATAGVELAQRAGLAAAAHTVRLVSTVWEAVLEAAQVTGADVIVTGTRSLHGVREMVSNTLSHSLIQHSTRPVLAIPTPLS